MARAGVRTGILERTRSWLIEALGGSALGAFSSSGTEDAGWRPITERVAGKAYRRDLSPLSQEQMLRVAHYLYGGNALAQFLINIPVALTVGRQVGFTLEYDYEQMGVTREAAQKLAHQARRLLDPWWEHPAHDFKGRGTRYAKTYLVTGEVLLLIPKEGINPTTGLPMLDYVDSQLIHDVEGKNGLATTPGRVLVKRMAKEPAAFDVILPGIPPKSAADDMATLEDGKTSEGECFFFRHTGRLNSLRGVSDLLGQADWIDQHDQLLFGRVDKAILSNTLVHELTVEGAPNPKAVDDEVAKFTKALKPGGVWGHNEKIKHEVKTADLKEADNAALLRAVLLHVLGSKGYPEHWFAEGDNTNKATSGEQTEVAFKVLEELQEELLGLFAVPLQYAYDQLAEKQRVFPQRDTGVVRLFPNLPKISERDITRIGGVVANVESALDVAVESGRVSRSTAQRVTLTMVEKLTGEHVDADDEAEKVTAETAEREAASAKAQADQAQRGYDKALGGGPDDDDGRERERTTEAVDQIGRLLERAEELVAQLQRGHALAEASLAAHPAAAPGPVVIEPSVTVHMAPTHMAATIEAKLPPTPPTPVSVHTDVHVPEQPPAVVESNITVQPAAAAVVVQPSPPGPTIVEAAVNVPAPQPTPVTIENRTEVNLPDTLKVAVTDVPETEQTVERDDQERLQRTVTRVRKKK